jgi:hypothetical protein
MTAELRLTSPDETTAADYGRGHGGDPTVVDDLYGTAVGGIKFGCAMTRNWGLMTTHED